MKMKIKEVFGDKPLCRLIYVPKPLKMEDGGKFR
jgi:hypothetical protein